MLLMGKSTISMAIFNCYVSSPEGTKGNFLIFNFSPVAICRKNEEIAFGQHTKNDGQSPPLIGKSTNSMAMFNSSLYVYQRLPLHF